MNKIVLVAMVVSIISGCVGLSHVRVNVPAFEVSGVVAGQKNATDVYFFYIVVPEFYGASGAFVSLVNGNLTTDSLYQWKEAYSSKGQLFNTNFNEENRYIGSMFPFSPSKETMESRIIFIYVNGSDTVYKVFVHGDDASVEKSNIKLLKNILPDSLRRGIKEQWGGPREKQIEDEIEFYRRVNWEKSDDLIIQEVSRDRKLDRLKFELNFKGNS